MISKMCATVAIFAILLTGIAVADVQVTRFAYKLWSEHYITTGEGISNDYNFAGYANNKIPNIVPNINMNVVLYNSTASEGQLHKILIDDNSSKIIDVGYRIALNDGYSFKVVDFDNSSKLIQIALLKGHDVTILPDVIAISGSGGGGDYGSGDNVVDSTLLSSGDTYVFSKKLGNISNVPIILVHIRSVSVDRTTVIDGIFQTSEDYINKITPIPTVTQTPVPTVLVTPLPSITPTAIATLSLPAYTSTPIPTYTSLPKSTYIPPSQTPIPKLEIKKRAKLQVTYEVVPKSKQEATVSVYLKNIGDATASHINLSIDNPVAIEARALSGSEQSGNIVLWKGELKPGEEHISQYSVKVSSEKNIEIPLKITYAKISPMEKAEALGIAVASSADTEALLSPEDWDYLIMILKLFNPVIPGFGFVLVLIAFLLIVRIKRRK